MAPPKYATVHKLAHAKFDQKNYGNIDAKQSLDRHGWYAIYLSNKFFSCSMGRTAATQQQSMKFNKRINECGTMNLNSSSSSFNVRDSNIS